MGVQFAPESVSNLDRNTQTRRFALGSPPLNSDVSAKKQNEAKTMAYSIQQAANTVLELADREGLCIEQKERENMKEHGEANIYGFMCKVVNVLTLKSCRILINTSWFSSEWSDFSKPSMKQGANNPKIDFQLIPTSNKLLAIHYLDLRHYALFLEKEREHWFAQSYWGMQIDEDNETFIWTGGNTISFPLIKVQKGFDMQKRHKEILKTFQII